jgi:glycerol-3-phosphate cytidylyltransferase
MVVGYTAGVFDLLHAGHVNVLKNAKALCDVLIVGVTTDELVAHKNSKCLMAYEDRKAIVESIRYVDAVVPQFDLDKVEAHRRLKFDILFVGDDWFNSASWNDYESRLKEQDVKVIYFPYTKGISSTELKSKLLGFSE